jgi:regulatory protein
LAVDPAPASGSREDGGAAPERTLQRALEVAYRYLGSRDRTVLEVRRRLERDRVDRATADAAIAELERQGYLDDARYARRYAEDRRSLDGWGDERIERRLLDAGVAPEAVAAAVGVRDPGDVRAAAVAVLRRRMREPPRTDRDRRRALGLLVRRGYDVELAHEAVRAFERGA